MSAADELRASAPSLRRHDRRHWTDEKEITVDIADRLELHELHGAMATISALSVAQKHGVLDRRRPRRVPLALARKPGVDECGTFADRRTSQGHKAIGDTVRAVFELSGGTFKAQLLELAANGADTVFGRFHMTAEREGIVLDQDGRSRMMVRDGSSSCSRTCSATNGRWTRSSPDHVVELRGRLVAAVARPPWDRRVQSPGNDERARVDAGARVAPVARRGRRPCHTDAR